MSPAKTHPKGEGGKKERKRRRKRTGRVTTGEEHPLPQGPFGPRCDGESDDATANNDPLAYGPQVPVAGPPNQNQVDTETAAKRSQPLNIEEEKNDVYSSKRANNQSSISRY